MARRPGHWRAPVKAPEPTGSASIPTERPETWEDLIELLFDGSYNRQLDRFRSPYVFRGMGNADWGLKPSLHRLGHPPELIGQIEKALLRSFKKYAHLDVNAQGSDWKWLSIAQHHKLPTRLLDWTFSPFVGWYFATDEMPYMDRDGVVWMVDFVAAGAWLPPPLARVLRDNFAVGFSVEMLEKAFPQVSLLEGQKGQLPEFVIFFEPPSLDARIINQ